MIPAEEMALMVDTATKSMDQSGTVSRYELTPDGIGGNVEVYVDDPEPIPYRITALAPDMEANVAGRWSAWKPVWMVHVPNDVTMRQRDKLVRCSDGFDYIVAEDDSAASYSTANGYVCERLP